MYISNDAAIDFYVMSTTSLQNKLINDSEYTKRLISLREMLDPRSRMLKGLILSKVVESITTEEKAIFEDNKDNSEQDNRNVRKSIFIENSLPGNKGNINIKSDNDSDILDFTTKENGAHNTKWRFYEGDMDHLPSIPHGHSINDHSLVLNPFTREVYPENKRKEDKRLIKMLWNNKKFRETAWKNLELHLNNPEHVNTALRYKELLQRKCETVKNK